MNENSPICASATATARPTRSGYLNAMVMASAASGLPDEHDGERGGEQARLLEHLQRISSMPTETKNSTANASRIGSASDAARTLKSDRATTSPARKAPSAIDTPKMAAEPTAIPRARTSTQSVKSSRERVAATRASSQGISRVPATIVNSTSAPTLSAARPMVTASPVLPVGAEECRHQHQHQHRQQVLHDQPADRDVAGRGVQVPAVGQDADQHDRAGDRQRNAEHEPGAPGPAEPMGEPRRRAPWPRRSERARPGIATRRTASSSSTWNCSPTPNISRMTPISANCSARCWSATNPGV